MIPDADPLTEIRQRGEAYEQATGTHDWMTAKYQNARQGDEQPTNSVEPSIDPEQPVTQRGLFE